MNKTLHNTCASGTTENVSDVEFWGNGDTFKLISKASSEQEGWMKSTKAMDTGTGCVVQVTTQQRNLNGSYSIAEALTFVPDVTIMEVMSVTEEGGAPKVTARFLMPPEKAEQLQQQAVEAKLKAEQEKAEIAANAMRLGDEIEAASRNVNDELTLAQARLHEAQLAVDAVKAADEIRPFPGT